MTAVVTRPELEQSPLADLHTLASEIGIEGYRRLRRDDLIDALLGPGAADTSGARAERPDRPERAERPERPSRSRSGRRGRGRGAGSEARDGEGGEGPASAEASPQVEAYAEGEPDVRDDEPQEELSGLLELLPNGSGFLRPERLVPSDRDAYVSPAQIRRCELRAGDEVVGPVRAARRSERHPSLVRVDTVNGLPAEPPAERPRFEELTPVWASEPLPGPDGLEVPSFGRGSRVALSGSRGGGASATLRSIVAKVAESHPDIELSVVLVDTLPEEATEWRRGAVAPVAGGPLDGSIDERVGVLERVVERAKRVVERGGDALVAVDGLDLAPASAARRLFGAGRKAEEGGSLTVLATTGRSVELEDRATTRIPTAAEGAATLRADLLAPPAPARRRRAAAGTGTTTRRSRTTKASEAKPKD